MATVINSSTTGGLIVSPDLSGQIALQSNGTTIATITPTGITTQVGVPVFSVYQSSTQNIAHNSNTKVQYQSKSFDTNNNFDATTNYRFQPTVAGYYNLYAQLNYTMTSNSFLVLYKVVLFQDLFLELVVLITESYYSDVYRILDLLLYQHLSLE